MALTQCSVAMSFSWAFSVAVAGFQSRTQGPDSLSYSLSPDVATFNEAYVAKLSLAASATADIDLQSFTDVNATAVVLTKVIGLFVVPTGTGSACEVKPGASNGLAWYWAGTGPTLTVPAGGAQGYVQPTAK